MKVKILKAVVLDGARRVPGEVVDLVGERVGQLAARGVIVAAEPLARPPDRPKPDASRAKRKARAK